MSAPGRNRSLPALLLLSLPLAVLLSACSPAKGKEGQATAPAVAVDTARTAPSEMEEAVEVVGTLTAKNEAEVRSEYSGTVAEVPVMQWLAVKKGTPLARLDTREVDAVLQGARAAELQAQVGAARARRELERTQKLKEAGLATQQALDDARTAAEAADAATAAAKAQFAVSETRLSKAVLRAPIDGVVSERNVNVGDYVQNMGEQPPLFKVVDNRLLELTVTVPSTRYASLRVGQPVAFTTDAIPGREFRGKVSFINPAADEASRTVKVKAEVPNEPEVLKTGLFAKGRIVTGTRQGVLSVPRSALQSWDTVARKGAVWVVEGGAARRRAVETGATPGEGVEIVSGLKGGEEVVVRGGFNLKEGDPVRTAPAAAQPASAQPKTGA